MNTQHVPIERLPVCTAQSAPPHGTQSRRGRDAFNEMTIDNN